MKIGINALVMTTLLLALSACVTLSESGNKIVEANSETEVSNCKLIGEVKAPPPFIGPSDAMNTLKNETAKVGGDTLFVTYFLIGTATGNAYTCG
ncbi:MAG: hypothetical protein V7740_14505 [Pseudomonas marincola]